MWMTAIMINFFKPTADRSEIEALEKKAYDLETKLINALQERDNYKKRLDDHLIAAKDLDFAIDFDALEVFSIERMCINNEDKTIVGYWVEETVALEGKKIGTQRTVREWTLYCSHRRHDDLVRAFRKWKDSK